MLRDRLIAIKNELQKRYPQGRENYIVEDNTISVGWKEFSQNPSNPSNAVIFIPGWGFSENSKSIIPICKAFANYTKESKMYAIQARSEEISPDSFAAEASGILQFIKDREITNITVAAHSFGGAKAMHLVSQLLKLHPEIHVNGLILYESVSLYDERKDEFMKNYLREIGIPSRTHTFRVALDGTIGVVEEIARSGRQFRRRLSTQIDQAIKIHPAIENITVPVIQVQGTSDFVSQVAKMDPDIFPNGTILTAERGDRHGIVYSRAATVAKVSMRILDRSD